MDVPEERLELSRDNSQRLLRPQRLPISPSGPFEIASSNIGYNTCLQQQGCKYKRFDQIAKNNYLNLCNIM